MRIILGSVFLLLAGIAIGVSLSNGPTFDDFLLNLGTEIFGIVITIVIVDYLLEKRKQEEAAKNIAWEALNFLDHAIWVWQGGAREFNLNELSALLDLIEEEDPLPPFTQNLLLQIGSRADNSLRTKENILAASTNTRNAMETLRPLSKMRDAHNPLSNSEIQQILKEALSALTTAVGASYSGEGLDELQKHRNPSIDAQEWRHYGRD